MTESIERKLGPIYDAMDCQNYKMAAQQCNKLLKKYPNSHLVMALKATALEGQGKSSEALEICADVRKNADLSDLVLCQTLVYVYKPNGLHGDIIDIYEKALERDPENEETMNHLFMAHTRAGNFKQQQAIALKALKLFKDSRYLFWQITALFLQGKLNGDAFAATLSDRMANKALDDGKIENIEELLFLLITLEYNKKYTEALEILNGPWGDKLPMEHERQMMKIDFHKHLNNWDQVQEISKDLFQKNPDDWTSATIYFDAVFQNPTKETLENARELIQSLIEKDNVMKRGPLLAELELQQRAHQHNLVKDDEAIHFFVDRLVGYFKLIGDKMCCYDDMSKYISFLNGVSSGNRFFDLLEDVKPKSAVQNDIVRAVCYEKLVRVAGGHEGKSVDELITIAEQLWALFLTLQKISHRVAETDRRPEDDLVILVGHIHFDCYRQTDNQIYLFHAVFLLERALSTSKFNFQFKLLLIRFYTILGAFKRVIEIYSTLDIKQILHDTMSHYVVENANDLGFFNEALELCSETVQIYASNERETPEMICQAYKFGTYSKIEEFLNFQKMLRQSMTKSITETEILRSDIMAIVNLDDNSILSWFGELNEKNLQNSDDFLNGLYDNRDRSIMMNTSTNQDKYIEKMTRPDEVKSKKWISQKRKAIMFVKHVLSGETTEQLYEVDTCSVVVLQIFASILNNARSQTEISAESQEEIMKNFEGLLKSARKPVSFSFFKTIVEIIEVVALTVPLHVALKKEIEQQRKLKSAAHKTYSAFATSISKSLVGLLNQLTEIVGHHEKDIHQWKENEELRFEKFVLNGNSSPGDANPVVQMLVDEKNAPDIHFVLKANILGSWSQSLSEIKKKLLALTSRFQ